MDPYPPPSRARKIRLFDDETNNADEKEMCVPEANFRTDPLTRPRKLKADRAAVDPGLVIDLQL
jgi:hypothetical protein